MLFLNVENTVITVFEFCQISSSRQNSSKKNKLINIYLDFRAFFYSTCTGIYLATTRYNDTLHKNYVTV